VLLLENPQRSTSCQRVTEKVNDKKMIEYMIGAGIIALGVELAHQPLLL